MSAEPKPSTLPASALPGAEPAEGSPARPEGAARARGDGGGTWHPYSERRPTALERAAERYRDAWQADRAATETYEAAYWAWRKADVPPEGPEHDELTRTREVVRRTEDAHEAALDALIAAARGER